MARRLQYQIHTEPILPPIPSGMGWFTPWTDPVRVISRDVYFEFLARDPFPRPKVNPASVPTWFNPLSEPVRIVPRAAYFDAFTISQFPISNLDPSKIPTWFQGLSVPVRTTARDAYFEAFNINQFPLPNVNPANVPVWFSQLSVPPGRPVGLPVYYLTADVGNVGPVSPSTGVVAYYTVSGPDVRDLFTANNDVVYDYGGHVSHRTK